MSKAIHTIIFAFIVGGLVGYGIATTQALNNAIAVADAVPIPDARDARQVEITSPTPLTPCPQPTVHNPGIPFTPAPMGTYITQAPVTNATAHPKPPVQQANPSP